MTNEQNKSIKVQTMKTREPIEFKSTVRLEGQTSKDINNVNLVTFECKILNKETLDSEMIVNGETSVSVLYQTDNGEFAQVKQDFSWEEKCPLIGANTLLVSAVVKNYEVLGVDSDSITLNLLHNLNIVEISPEEVGVSIEDEIGLEKNIETISIQKVTGSNNNIFSVSEELEETGVNFNVISRSATICVDNSFAGVDSVTVTGNIFVDLLLSTDAGEIKAIKREIPFKQEIECFGANPNNIVISFANIVKIMAGVREKDENASVIVLDVEIDANVVSLEDFEVDVLKDAFSSISKTSISMESVNVKLLSNVAYGNCNVDFSQSLAGKTGVDEIISVVNPKLSVSDAYIDNLTCEMEGVISLLVIYKNNNDNLVQTFEAVCPVQATFEVDEGFNHIDDFTIALNSYKLKAGNEIQFDADVYYNLTSDVTKNISYVSNIDYLDSESAETSAIRVYTVKEDEKVFDIAKNLGISISTLVSQNPDLENGVVAGEKVYVYVPLVINF